MHLRRLAPLVAVLALAVPLATGCGAEDAAGVDVADAASATAKKGTASYTFKLRAEGLGLPSRTDLEMSGVTSLTKPQLTLRLDAGPLLAGFGLPVPSAVLEGKVDGATVYIKPPSIPGLAIPGGKEWISLDLARAARSFGVDPAGLAPLFSFDPAAYLRLVTTAKGLEQVGEATINGTKTRHFRGSYSIDDAINALPASKQAGVRKSVDEVQRKLKLDRSFLTAATPIELWIDKDGVARRMSSRQSLPAQEGLPAGKFSFTYDLIKFGTPLDVSKPDSVFDATKPLLDAIKQLSALSSGTTTPG